MLPFLLLTGVIILGAGLFLFRPLAVGNLVSRPDPASDYQEAERRISAVRVREGERIIPDARLQYLTHGDRTDRAIVFVHGYTNCPRQFVKLGEMFFQQGYNVLIANLPRHGLPDRMNDLQAGLTAEELAAYADEMADIAQGLGRRVTFAGISCGGVVSAWAWANRADVSTAVLMAPAFGFRMIPLRLTFPIVNLLSVLPNFYGWWDPVKKNQGAPEHTYPRYATRALRQILLLAYAVRGRVKKEPPAGKELIVVTNPNDWAVSNAMIGRVLREWRRLGIPIAHRQFEASWKLDHDFIEPAQPHQPIERTYPLLLEWITGKK
ncbi:MAG: alpha/beta fold hydrolase [Anaerolineales bacterium]